MRVALGFVKQATDVPFKIAEVDSQTIVLALNLLADLRRQLLALPIPRTHIDKVRMLNVRFGKGRLTPRT
jgi:hypothetical protein